MAVLASAVYRVRAGGSNTNGGGWDPVLGAGHTDYSQQAAAQLTLTDIASSNTTTVTSAVGGFTAAMIGSAIWLTGGGATAGAYFITAVASLTSMTIDRAAGTIVAGGGKVGGAWADFWTNTLTAASVVPGNYIYILGTGTPTTSGYGSPDYTIPTYFTPAAGGVTTGYVTYAADPATPGYTGTKFGGMPLISCPGLSWYNSSWIRATLLWLFASGAANPTLGVFYNNNTVLNSVVFDQNGYDIGLVGTGGSNIISRLYGCEVFSSVAKRTTNAQVAVSFEYYSSTIQSCNIHDAIGPGLHLTIGASLTTDNVIAKNGGYGIRVEAPGSFQNVITGNTIDGNTGNGIEVVTVGGIVTGLITKNLLTNHATNGIAVLAGTTASNDLVKGLIDYNTFFGNGTDVSAISYGAHDVHGGSNPFAGQSTENYATTGLAAADGGAFGQHKAGQTTTVVNNAVAGAVQPAAGGAGGGLLTNPGMTGNVNG